MKICRDCRIPKPLSEFYLKLGYYASACKECDKARTRNWYQEIKDDSGFIEKNNARAAMWNRENKEKRNKKLREYHRHLKMEVILAYGGKCACCGESNFYFLTLDHINDDGAGHRKEVSTRMYVWARANGYPESLQVLCYNCNCAKAFSGFGQCPHKVE